MKTLLRIALPLVALGAAGSAQASTNYPGYVTETFAMPSGQVMFSMDGGRTARPECAANIPRRWAFDGTTPAGQIKFAVVLMAKALHKPVEVVGLDTCNVWGDTETVEYIIMDN